VIIDEKPPNLTEPAISTGADSAALRFISYAKAYSIADDDLIVVDCHYPRGLALAHLYEPRVPEHVRANTSTDAALKAIAAGLATQRKYVTCNHWDIDGFLAVWSLINPYEAAEDRELLLAAAMLGDFREFDASSKTGHDALKLCALLNAVEARKFCLPFGDLDDATIEYEVAEQKFEYFLPRLADWLSDLDSHTNLWQREYDRVLSDLARIDSGEVRIVEHEEIGLSVIRTPVPLHYYAICSRIRGGAMLTIFDERSYIEFEYRYETRVGRLDKTTIARRYLSELARKLTELEQAQGIRWVFDNILLGGPMLRPEPIDAPLEREACYQSMEYRLIQYPNIRTEIDSKLIESEVIAALTA
jgi:hypothetical protein